MAHLLACKLCKSQRILVGGHLPEAAFLRSWGNFECRLVDEVCGQLQKVDFCAFNARAKQKLKNLFPSPAGAFLSKVENGDYEDQTWKYGSTLPDLSESPKEKRARHKEQAEADANDVVRERKGATVSMFLNRGSTTISDGEDRDLQQALALSRATTSAFGGVVDNFVPTPGGASSTRPPVPPPELDDNRVLGLIEASSDGEEPDLDASDAEVYVAREDQKRLWLLVRTPGLRMRERQYQSKEMQVLQELIDKKDKITTGLIMTSLQKADACSFKMKNHHPTDSVARKYVSRIFESYHVRHADNPKITRFITAIPRRRPKYLGNHMHRVQRFENVLRTWHEWNLSKNKACKYLGLPKGSDLRGLADLANVDEVPARRFYAEVGGWSTLFTESKPDAFTAARESAQHSGSILMWSFSDPSMRVKKPIVCLSRDYINGPSSKVKQRKRNCMKAISQYGECTWNEEGTRNGYISKQVFWAQLRSILKEKVTRESVPGARKRALILLFDSCTTHSWDSQTELEFTRAGIFFCHIKGGCTMLIQPIDVCSISSRVRYLGEKVAAGRDCTTFENEEFWRQLEEIDRATFHSIEHFEKCGFELGSRRPLRIGSELYAFLTRTRELHPQQCADLDRKYYRELLTSSANTMEDELSE
ncbi:unnamed protein product [Amoebophrya sp. A25]|nr:unnamed protein product [Amoebophrya sp. A25]|eukprot:GSA25T00024575001.1